jgi:hypothetical protein
MGKASLLQHFDTKKPTSNFLKPLLMHGICMSLKNVNFGVSTYVMMMLFINLPLGLIMCVRFISHPISRYDKWHQNWMTIFVWNVVLVTGGCREILQGCKANGGYFLGHQCR